MRRPPQLELRQEGNVHFLQQLRLDSPELKYSDTLKAGHINQDLPRYELHRVWHVTATLKEGERHIYAKRDFYIDEIPGRLQ